MSRYINADAMIANALQDSERLYLESVAKHTPSIDIVRCKECRHWIGETEYYEDRKYKACWQLCGQYMDSEFWCKYGEREGE